MSERQRIAKITLDERTVIRRSADIEHERRVAIFDLLEGNSFRPIGDFAGPYHVLMRTVKSISSQTVMTKDGT